MTKNRGQRLDRQRMLAELGEFALQCEDLDEVLATACEIAGQALAPRRARIYEIESADDTLVVRAEVGCGDDGAAKLRLPMTARSSETCSIKLDKVIVIPDITRDTRFEVPEFMRRAGVVAFVNVPILLPRNRAFGLLQVDATEPYEFDEEDVAFLRICAMILGPVIDRLRRLSDLDSARERLDIIVGNALDYAIFLTDAEDRIIDWPPGAEAVFGYTCAEAVGRSANILYTVKDRQSEVDRAKLDKARDAAEARDARWYLRKNGDYVFINGMVRALRDRDGKVNGFIKIGQDMTARRMSQERLRVMIEGTPHLTWKAGNKGCWTWSSPQWTEFTGRSGEDSQAMGWLNEVHPDDRGATMEAWGNAARLRLMEVEHRIHHQGEDRYRWFQTRAAPVRDTDPGPIKEWLGTSTDVDDLRCLREQQHVMMAELQHRTRNLIAVVQGIAFQTGRRAISLADFQARFDDRLAALSRIQGLLSRSQTRPIEFATLIDMEFDAMGIEPGGNIEVDVPMVNLPNGVVQVLALALHELMINARKYGALNHEGGALKIGWAIGGNEQGPPRLLFEWREENLTPIREMASPAESGYGRELIERALPYSLGATTRYELSSASLLCTIDMPLRRRGRWEKING